MIIRTKLNGILLLFAVAILSSSFSFADAPEKSGHLSSKVIIKDNCGFFVLSDGSFWKAIEFKKRMRSLSEWWNDVKLVSENYECAPSDWVLGAEVQAFSKRENLAADESNASNQEALRQCTHLLVNTGNRQVLFAIPLSPADCLTQVYQGAKKEGQRQGDKNEYQKGYNMGLERGGSNLFASSGESYDNGYKDGYKEGFSKGTSTCHNTEAELYNEIYSRGHTDGYEFGFKEGYQSAVDDQDQPGLMR